MSDIKQAAKWMREGQSVTRPNLRPRWFDIDSRRGIYDVHPDCNYDREYRLKTDDILADDWEIA